MIDEQGAVLGDLLAGDDLWGGGVRDPIAIEAAERGGSVEWHAGAEVFIDGVGEVDLLALPASEEEGLVLADGSADFESILIELDDRLGEALRVGVELLRVERGVAEEFED